MQKYKFVGSGKLSGKSLEKVDGWKREILKCQNKDELYVENVSRTKPMFTFGNRGQSIY